MRVLLAARTLTRLAPLGTLSRGAGEGLLWYRFCSEEETLMTTQQDQIEADFEVKVASAFNEMIARAGGVPPAFSA